MRLQFILSVLKIFALVFTFVIFSSACSKNEEQVEEEVEEEGEGEGEEGEEGEGSNAAEELTEAETEKSNEEEAAAESTGEVAPADASAIADAEPVATDLDKAAPSATESLVDNSAQTPGVSSEAPGEAFTGDRHVYYIKHNGAKIRSQASAQGPVVGALAKGDHVVAVAQGSWAQLENGQFVAISSVTKRGVGRSLGKNPWRSNK